MTEPGNLSGDGHLQTASVNVRLPQFWQACPEAWFIQAEAQFEVARIRRDETKYAFLYDVEEMFTIGMFAQFMDSSITICITGFQLIVVPARSLKILAVISYLLAKLFQISCYCWNGHAVTMQSISISDSCYKSEWYRCSSSIKKNIFIIMERCKKPIRMTAGKFFILSIVTLTAVLRTSYSYFAVLRRVYNN